MNHNATIHETAIVEESMLGTGTKVWMFSHLYGCNIGRDCLIGQGCSIHPGVKIGNRVKIQNNVHIFTGVTIEDDCFIAPCVVFTNVKTPTTRKAGTFEKTYVRKGAVIGANSTILPGVEIGENAFIGAGSVVTKNVKPNSLVYGNPAIRHNR